MVIDALSCAFVGEPVRRAGGAVKVVEGLRRQNPSFADQRGLILRELWAQKPPHAGTASAGEASDWGRVVEEIARASGACAVQEDEVSSLVSEVLALNSEPGVWRVRLALTHVQQLLVS